MYGVVAVLVVVCLSYSVSHAGKAVFRKSALFHAYYHYHMSDANDGSSSLPSIPSIDQFDSNNPTDVNSANEKSINPLFDDIDTEEQSSTDSGRCIYYFVLTS